MNLQAIRSLVSLCLSYGTNIIIIANMWGSMVEGLDLPGEMIRHCVIFGMPWSRLDDPFMLAVADKLRTIGYTWKVPLDLGLLWKK